MCRRKGKEKEENLCRACHSKSLGLLERRRGVFYPYFSFTIMLLSLLDFYNHVELSLLKLETISKP